MEARSLGPQVNTPAYELCPIVTPDGKYLFFNSSRGGEIHAWWVEATLIENLKSKAIKSIRTRRQALHKKSSLTLFTSL